MDSNLLSLPKSSSTSPWKYHVFLSFKGEDTRYKFTDHLYTALVKRGIVTFRDNENLEKGKVISSELLKAIEESRFAIVILSENYAFSSWCLDELAKIIECEKELGMRVLPVFHYVNPTDVRKPTETFKKAFDAHEKRFQEKRVKTWRDALIRVGNLAGFHLKNSSPETQDIQRIVREISCHVGNLAGCHLKNISPKTQDIQRIVRQISHTVLISEFTELTNEDVVNFEKLLSADVTVTAQAAFDKANMEELHMAALAYYRNASNELSQRATELFNSMDTNGDGGVSFDEFVQFFAQNGYDFDCNIFRSLDRDGNGCLDFFEVVTFYYILKTRRVCCNYCGNFQMGLYFTCVACFDNAGCTGHTYDLCSKCYGERRHQQQHPHHNYFLDSYVLLRAKAGLPLLAGAPNLQQALVQHAPNISQQALVPVSTPNTPQQKRWKALQALEMALIVGNMAAHGCSIM